MISRLTLGVIGAAAFIAGTSVSMTMANVVLASLHTVFVCFAEVRSMSDYIFA